MMFQPLGQCRPEQFAAKLITGQPKGLEHGQHLHRIARRSQLAG